MFLRSDLNRLNAKSKRDSSLSEFQMISSAFDRKKYSFWKFLIVIRNLLNDNSVTN